MYGQMHVVLQEMVEEKYGRQTWMKVLEKCQFNEEDNFMTFQVYPDSMTFALVKTIADVIELPVDEVLKIFGDHFLTYCMKHGYDKMLTTLGADFVCFVENLDSLHSLLSFTYSDITAPSFRCIEQEDGSLIIHYYSIREGLAPVVDGLMQAVGKQLFQQEVTLTMVTQNLEDIGLEAKLYHTEFSVEVKNLQTDGEDSLPLLIRRRSRYSSRPTFDQHSCDPGIASIIRSEDFNSAFPYNILLDRFLLIQECGDNIQKLAKNPIEPGTSFRDVATILSPAIYPSAHNVFNFINSAFIVALHSQAGQKPFILKGQMIWLPHSFHLLFVGSPRLTSLDDFQNMKIYMCDIPIYDVTRDLVLLNQQRIAEIDVAHKLDEATMELKKVSRDLEEEKGRTEELLYQMMPRKVAAQLIAGNAVSAEKYESCTTLFCDIVAFTEIAQKCPADDIVNMLNDIHHRFDTHTDAHNVYKVETIGDAYMAVTGVPEVQEDHAQQMADFAMDMLDEACYVMSPLTGKPLKIRVGLHSGGVVACVIGKKRPRYDIYGDTVITASRMESCSAGGRIHLSHSSFKLLYPYGYEFRARGEIVVRGKGLMKTYFLLGHSRRPMLEPADPFTDLPKVAKVVNSQPRSPGDGARKGIGPSPSDANASALVYPPSDAPLSPPPCPVQHLWPTARVQCRLHRAWTRTGDSGCGGSGEGTRSESRVPRQVGVSHCATRRHPLGRNRVDPHPAWSCPLPAGVSRHGHGGAGRGGDRSESVWGNSLPGRAEDLDAVSSSVRDSGVNALCDRTMGLRAVSPVHRGLDTGTTATQLSRLQLDRGESLTVSSTEHSLSRRQLDIGESLTVSSTGNLLSRHQLDRGESLTVSSTEHSLSRCQLDRGESLTVSSTEHSLSRRQLDRGESLTVSSTEHSLSRLQLDRGESLTVSSTEHSLSRHQLDRGESLTVSSIEHSLSRHQLDRGESLTVSSTGNLLSRHQLDRGESLTVSSTEHSLSRLQLDRGESLTVNSTGNLLSRHQLDRGESLTVNSTGNLLSRRHPDGTVARSQDAAWVRKAGQRDTARSSADAAPATHTARQSPSPQRCPERHVDRDNWPGVWELHGRSPCGIQPHNCCLAQTVRADRDRPVTHTVRADRDRKDVAQHWRSPTHPTPLSIHPPPHSCLQHLPSSPSAPSHPAPTHRQRAGQFSEDRRCRRQASLDAATAVTGQSLESCPCSLQ